jgi:hypothetical protein
MYPLTQWPYDKLIARLRDLHDAGFKQETVVGVAQVLEQTLKRALRSEMVQYRHHVVGGQDEFRLVSTTTRAEIDNCLRFKAQSVNSIQKVWRLVFAGQAWASLPRLIDDLAGRNAWVLLTRPKPKSKPLLLPSKPPVDVPYGLFPLRHHLVHGTNSPPRNVIDAWASHSVVLAEALLEPTAWTSRGFRSPFQRVFPFRDRPGPPKRRVRAS